MSNRPNLSDKLNHYVAYGEKKTGEDKAHSSKITDGRNPRLHLSRWSGYLDGTLAVTDAEKQRNGQRVRVRVQRIVSEYATAVESWDGRE